MTRIRELIAAAAQRYPNDTFFSNFAESCRMEDGKRRSYRSYDDALRYREAGQLKHCEVKTIGLSDAEIGRGQSRGVLGTRYSGQLDSGFLNKFSSVVATAKAQISARKTDGLVYLVVLFDDMALDHYPEYRRQLISFCREKEIHDVYIKVGLRWFRRIRITRRCS